jgi:hypothetical protein
MGAFVNALPSALFVLAVVCFLVGGAATADDRILDSNLPQLKPGTILPDNAKLNIPKDGWVSILTSANTTKRLEGPYEGPITAYKPNPARSEAGPPISLPVPGTRGDDD